MRRYLPLTALIIALIPLLLPVPSLHIDEVANWVPRVEAFLTAMQTGDYALTVQTEHPGITTMALGALGELAYRATVPNPPQLITVARMQFMRFPITLFNAAALIASYAVLRHLLAVDPRLAFVAALTWAADPYLRWYSRLLHIDGMSTSLMALAFLLILLALRWHDPNAEPFAIRWRPLLLAAVIAGLAGLTRFTAFFLVGMLGLLLLIHAAQHYHDLTIRRFVMRMALPVISFTALMVVTWAALYPGMWTNAGDIYTQTLHGFENAGSPHENGNYFRGAETDDPGAIFYPVALLLRMTPITLIGLALTLIAVWGGAWRDQRRLLLAILLYAVLYTAALTLQAKKFDRYLMPVFPMLHLLAAFGWVWLANWLRTRQTWFASAGRMAWIGAVGFVLGYSLWFFPDDYAHANPLFGGGATAEHMLLVGAGEGMPQIVDSLAMLSGVENACHQFVYTRYGDLMAIYTPCARVVLLDDIELDVLGNAYYIVHYLSHRQRHPDVTAILDAITPLESVTIHGINYADIYDAEDVRAYLRTQSETQSQ